MKTALYIVIALLVFGIVWFISSLFFPESVRRNVDILGERGGLEIISRDVPYYASSTGFLVEPKTSGNYPGVIMIHEWWGLNEQIKQMAENLAKEGYYVLAVDLYQGKIAATSSEAQRYVASVNQTEAVNNLRAAKTYLQEKRATKIASLGWCFGGGKSLALAISGEPLDATVLYYGTPLITDRTQLANIKWPVLGIFGDKDTSIPAETVNTFDANLDALNIPNEIYIYPGVGHAFANPSGMNYAPNETKDAWRKTLTFLQTYLK